MSIINSALLCIAITNLIRIKYGLIITIAFFSIHLIIYSITAWLREHRWTPKFTVSDDEKEEQKGRT